MCTVPKPGVSWEARLKLHGFICRDDAVASHCSRAGVRTTTLGENRLVAGSQVSHAAVSIYAEYRFHYNCQVSWQTLQLVRNTAFMTTF